MPGSNNPGRPVLCSFLRRGFRYIRILPEHIKVVGFEQRSQLVGGELDILDKLCLVVMNRMLNLNQFLVMFPEQGGGALGGRGGETEMGQGLLRDSYAA